MRFWSGIRKSVYGDEGWERICLDKMKELSGDSNAYARGSVIYAAGQGLKIARRKEEYFSILNAALRDPHYELRNQATAFLNES